jgi:hypothetical protein
VFNLGRQASRNDELSCPLTAGSFEKVGDDTPINIRKRNRKLEVQYFFI